MESGLIAVIIFGIVLLILVPFIYYGLRMAGYNKAAMIVSLALFFTVVIPMVKYGYRSQMYSNDDLINDLHQAGIGFKGEPKIVSTDISGIKKMKQQTILIMDSTDINIIINRIETDPRFEISPKILSLKEELGANARNKTNRNYRFKDNYILETYGMIDNYTIRYSELKFRKGNDTVFFKKEEVY
ncbi:MULTISPECIES: hypothetical protein [Empedobacter]|uniref:hypothetical protein n=1 Tax=Empedobacter TaxID=59734 RepID=UPI001CE0A0C5|nr:MULTISPECIES: hypothetical protein [Empedobacter]MCA4782045.1 hypothetical protein [Empedobacter stercoris]MDM1521934.1 hypothetical protein [Empedobacter sp. 225-1]MDM1542203.1 hypothetical protein [Empedobacter sp. 189-2]HJD86105.1 hypothetical protein [Empedobacter falsenii]